MSKQKMTPQEAGKKGGDTTKARHGKEFYDEILGKGRARLHEIIQKGKQAVDEEATR